MVKYTSVPTTFEACQLTLANIPSIITWMGSAYTQHSLNGSKQIILLPLITDYGTILATTGDWIVRDGSGKYLLCKDGAFQKLYQTVV